MPWPVHPTGFLASRGDEDSYKIERSLRFNSADSAYLSRTNNGSVTSNNVWTYSFWLKISSFNGTYYIVGTGSNAGADQSSIKLVNDSLEVINYISSSVKARKVTTQLFRDPSAWYHIVVSQNSNSSLKIYVNGSEVTDFSINTNPDTSSWILASASSTVNIGRVPSSNYLNGYLAEINFIDGQALTPSYFGETDAITGRWKAKAYSGTYGTNGFYLNFSDNSALTTTSNVGIGKDFSGNGNYWATNGLSVTAGAGNDSLVDSPTNYGTDSGVGGEVRGNYCTLNPLKNEMTLSNGNLAISGGLDTTATATMAIPPTGKWYFEFVPTGMPTSNANIGLASSQFDLANAGFTYAEHRVYIQSGNKASGAGSVSYGSSWTTNDVIGVAIDMDNGELVFYKNGLTQGVAFTDLKSSGKTWFPLAACYDLGTFAGDFNFGQRPFAYTAPSGFKALCTTNLPQPTIQKPSKYMDVVTYTGTGASNSISSLGFSPDLVWIKNRGGATSHAIYDTTRGTQAQLSSDTTDDEVTSSTGLTAFGSNGFTIGTSSLVNTSGTQYVAWTWDEAPIAGMDIVSYTGSGANRTIAHNLGVAPKMMIVKARVTASTDQGWPVYHTGVASDAETDYLLLNSTAAAADLNTVWNDTAPTSSVFSVGTNVLVNTNNDTYIAYIFAEVEGFSKFGSYTGNGSADGPFVYCGFRPRWVMIKCSSNASSMWYIIDTQRSDFNLADDPLFPNSSQSEGTNSIYYFYDIVSNGIKIRTSDVDTNGSGRTYIFAAFAESPFKYARAR